MASHDVRVPLCDPQTLHEGVREEIDRAIARVMRSRRFVLGPEVAAFEDALAAFCGAVHAVGVASGGDALLLVLASLGVGPGDQVICPAYGPLAIAGAVARLGAEPVFVDVDPATCNVDVDAVDRHAERCRRLKAIVAAHLFGQAAPLPQLEALAMQRGVELVEDASQAVGALDGRGRRVGASDHPCCFGFAPSDGLGACGDAGLVTTLDDRLAEHLRALRAGDDPGDASPCRLPMRSPLDALQAAVLRVKLRFQELWNEVRRSNAERYDERFRAAGARRAGVPLEGAELVLRVPGRVASPARHAFHRYVVRVPAALRDGLADHLADRRIETAVPYPTPLHLHPAFAGLGGREGDHPHAEAACRETLALPVHPELAEAQLGHVVDCTLGYLEKHARPPARPRRWLGRRTPAFVSEA